jgi:mRNA-degrading endonuclease RelE of RelBE toxin-antitoxin system
MLGSMIKKIMRSPTFIKQTKHLDNFLLKKLQSQITKIIENPQAGKPLKYTRGERALYVKPFRLVYAVLDEELILLKFDHRKKVYK